MSESIAMCRERLHEPTEPVNCYCKNCKVCICEKCGQTRHTRHTKVSIQLAAEEEKLKLRDAIEKGKKQIAELERQIQETSELFQVSKEKIAAARNSICTTVEELTRVLKEHEDLMLSELSVIEERQKSHHTIQREHLQASVKELESVVRNCETTLQSNTNFETLQAQIIEIEKSKRVLKAKQTEYYKPCHVGYLRDEKYIQDFFGAAPGKILASKTDPSRSLITGKNLEIAEAGRIKEFDITTTDSFGDPCYLEVDDIKVRVCSPMGKYIDGKVDDWHSSGKYNVTLTPDCDGEHEVTVLVNDQQLPRSPWNLSVRPHKYIYSFNFASLSRKHRKFKEPCALAIDNKTNKIAVADRNNRVQIFDLNDSQYLKELGEKGPAAIKLSNPTSVAFTNSGKVVVISSGTMFCFTTDGTFFGCINNKHLKVPFSLNIALDGQMVVCDIGDKSIKVLSPDGKDLLRIFSAPDSDDSPWEAVCHQDKFFVSYPTARCVKAFDMNGCFLHDIGDENSSEGQLQKPRGLAIDTFNNLVVCDEEHKTLNVFSLDGTLLNTVSSTKIDCPWSIAVSSAARWPFLIMADPRKRSVVFFD